MSQSIFRYNADRWPITIFVAYFMIDLWVYFSDAPLEFLLFWLVLGTVPKLFISSWNHHHQHCNVFKPVWLNKLLEVMYSLQTGVTGNAWLLHHNVGHHRHYLDQTKDESAWKDKQGRRMGPVRYTLVVSLTSYLRAFRTGNNYPKQQRTFVFMTLITALILAAALWYKPLHATMIFVLPMAISLAGTVLTTYFHHSGLDTDNRYHASYNILEPWYNLLTGNLGYHTAHHVKFGLHWSELPAFHASIAHEIPEHCYVTTFPMSFLRKIRSLFRKPNPA